MSGRIRFYNLLTVLLILLTAAFLVWAGLVIVDPRSQYNPFPPPTRVPTLTPPPPLVVTAGPTRTPPPPTPTFTPSWTPTITPTPTLTFTPSLTPILETATTIPTETPLVVRPTDVLPPTQTPTP